MPLYELASSCLGFCTDYPTKKRETTWSEFDRGGGGHLPLSGHMERHVPWLALTPE
jgi:hypothetical protein